MVERFEKFLVNFFNFVVCNLCQSSPSLTMLVPLWFIIISLVFFYLCKVLFSAFLQFKGNFSDGENNSKYHGYAPLRWCNLGACGDEYHMQKVHGCLVYLEPSLGATSKIRY